MALNNVPVPVSFVSYSKTSFTRTPTSVFPLLVEKSPKTFAAMKISGRFGSSKGGAGLLERPTFDQSQFDPSLSVEEGGEMGRLCDKKGPGSGDSYRVLLLDHERHTEKQVETVLPKVVPSVTPVDARRCFHESRQTGAGLVTVTVKEHAEHYSQMMIRSGLRSAIEPDSNVI
ncbi:hypothetical protein AMTRI_Chr09g13040 [Amborella trichopoda]